MSPPSRPTHPARGDDVPRAEEAMGQQDDGEDAPAIDPCFICPRCGKEDVKAAVRTRAGAYCQCHACGYVWHVDNLPAAFKSPLRRRKSDPPA